MTELLGLLLLVAFVFVVARGALAFAVLLGPDTFGKLALMLVVCGAAYSTAQDMGVWPRPLEGCRNGLRERSDVESPMRVETDDGPAESSTVDAWFAPSGVCLLGADGE